MRRLAPPALCVLLCVTLSGCSLGEFGDAILKTHFLDILLLTLGYVIGGAGAGFFTGVIGYLLVKRLGGYAWDWSWAKWLRRLAALGIVLTTTLAGACAGGCIGFASGVESFLKEGEQSKAALEAAGGPMADLTYYLLIVSERQKAALEAREVALGKGETPVELTSEELFELPADELASFKAGTVIAVERIQNLAQELPHKRGEKDFDRAVDEVLGKDEGNAISRMAIKEGSHFVIRYALERETNQKAGKTLASIFLRSFDFTLCANRVDDPQTISRVELSQHFASELYAPLLVLAIRKALIPWRWGSYAVLVLTPLGPVPFFWLARVLQRRRRARIAAAEEEEVKTTAEAEKSATTNEDAAPADAATPAPDPGVPPPDTEG